MYSKEGRSHPFQALFCKKAQTCVSNQQKFKTWFEAELVFFKIRLERDKVLLLILCQANDFNQKLKIRRRANHKSFREIHKTIIHCKICELPIVFIF